VVCVGRDDIEFPLLPGTAAPEDRRERGGSGVDGVGGRVDDWAGSQVSMDSHPKRKLRV
jgi:hypothetical protein